MLGNLVGSRGRLTWLLPRIGPRIGSLIGSLIGPLKWLLTWRAWRRAWPVYVASLALSCAHNVPQDSSSGEDGKQKGAKTVTLENGEAKTSGIVTYPGGDRVDWKLIELPDKQRGTLDIKLMWTPPRPGLQLAFDVFDEWNQPIVQSQRTSKKRSKGRTREATVEGAKGKYFVRIYAVGRGDAGKYRLSVDFKEKTSGPAFDPLKLEIPDPPKLAAVPEPEVPCDEEKFDPKNPACKNICPATGAPPGWPPCKDKCPTPPDVNIAACLATMDCPNPPDRRVRKCVPAKFPKCPDPKNPDQANPNCDNIKVPPVVNRIIAKTIQGSEVIITVGAGSNAGVAPNWSGTVLRGESEQPLTGGDIKLVRVDKAVTVGKVRLTPDQLLNNPRVRLSAP
jgi:hypothetical protein